VSVCGTPPNAYQRLCLSWCSVLRDSESHGQCICVGCVIQFFLSSCLLSGLIQSSPPCESDWRMWGSYMTSGAIADDVKRLAHCWQYAQQSAVVYSGRRVGSELLGCRWFHPSQGWNHLIPVGTRSEALSCLEKASQRVLYCIHILAKRPPIRQSIMEPLL
jgi:hypothetical protein